MTDLETDNQPIKIFYAHSTRNSSLDLYHNFCDKFNDDDRYMIHDPNKDPRAYNLAEEILRQIGDTDLFIADITPDDSKSDDQKTTYHTFNPNVICELQHAMSNGIDAVIILYDNRVIKNRIDIPIFFQACQFQEYSSHGEALDNLTDFVERYKKSNDARYQSIDIVHDKTIMNIISLIANVKITVIASRYDTHTDNIVLLCGYLRGVHGVVYLPSMQYIFSKGNRSIDLSSFGDLVAKLRHVETVSLLKWNRVNSQN